MTNENNKDLLKVDGLVKHFPITRGIFRREVGSVNAVDGISFEIQEGETLGLVGESGCGKSTAGRVILQLIPATAGNVFFKGRDLTSIDKEELRKQRQQMQMIFQDPFSSLNPRMNLFDIVSEPLLLNGVKNRSERQDRVEELLSKVGLRPEYMVRFPHAFSGGQRQRIGIARALALNPSLIVCDEPVSGLDVSVQAQVINLLMDLQDELGLSYLFVSHDLSIVRQISDSIQVMYLGRLVENGTPDEIFSSPKHPYTEALISAVPQADPDVPKNHQTLIGEIPNPASPPTGCYFHPRCAYATDECKKTNPGLTIDKSGRSFSCHHANDIKLKGLI